MAARAMADECYSDCTWTGPEATCDGSGKVTSMDKTEKGEAAPDTAPARRSMAS